MQAAEPSAESSASSIVQSLSCPKASCVCHKSAQRGHGLTHCPAHDDRHPSFNVSIKQGVVLVHCESGACSQAQILDALRDRNLWPRHDPTPAFKRDIVAEYDYKDIHGDLLYQTVRFVPKGFAQRKPDSHGGWIWNLSGVTRVLYRLPELLAADPKRLRIICEGEKDVDSLLRLGFVATSNVGGAGKWHTDYVQWFKDSLVCLIPDNDVAGRDHMRQVARSLQGQAHTILWLELPDSKPKGDVTDWLEAGGDADKLKLLIRKAEPFTETLFSPSDQLPKLSDQPLELLMIYTCVTLPAAISYLQPEDFTSDVARAMFKAIRAGEPIAQEGLVEPDDEYDEWAAICKLRDLSRRRAALRIAEHVLSAAGDTSRGFNPCLAADALRALCEHANDHNTDAKLSDVLGLL
jgi:hypothetical protein